MGIRYLIKLFECLAEFFDDCNLRNLSSLAFKSKHRLNMIYICVKISDLDLSFT